MSLHTIAEHLAGVQNAGIEIYAMCTLSVSLPRTLKQAKENLRGLSFIFHQLLLHIFLTSEEKIMKHLTKIQKVQRKSLFLFLFFSTPHN